MDPSTASGGLGFKLSLATNNTACIVLINYLGDLSHLSSLPARHKYSLKSMPELVKVVAKTSMSRLYNINHCKGKRIIRVRGCLC